MQSENAIENSSPNESALWEGLASCPGSQQRMQNIECGGAMGKPQECNAIMSSSGKVRHGGTTADITIFCSAW